MLWEHKWTPLVYLLSCWRGALASQGRSNMKYCSFVSREEWLLCEQGGMTPLWAGRNDSFLSRRNGSFVSRRNDSFVSREEWLLCEPGYTAPESRSHSSLLTKESFLLLTKESFLPAHIGVISPAHKGVTPPAHKGVISPAHKGVIPPAHKGVIPPCSQRSPSSCSQRSNFSLLTKESFLPAHKGVISPCSQRSHSSCSTAHWACAAAVHHWMLGRVWSEMTSVDYAHGSVFVPSLQPRLPCPPGCDDVWRFSHTKVPVHHRAEKGTACLSKLTLFIGSEWLQLRLLLPVNAIIYVLNARKLPRACSRREEKRKRVRTCVFVCVFVCGPGYVCVFAYIGKCFGKVIKYCTVRACFLGVAFVTSPPSCMLYVSVCVLGHIRTYQHAALCTWTISLSLLCLTFFTLSGTTSPEARMCVYELVYNVSSTDFAATVAMVTCSGDTLCYCLTHLTNQSVFLSFVYFTFAR